MGKWERGNLRAFYVAKVLGRWVSCVHHLYLRPAVYIREYLPFTASFTLNALLYDIISVVSVHP